MPRFSIKDLLIATTLIAVGMGMVYFAGQHHDSPETAGLALLIFFVGSALVGAGLMAPFKRPWAGALVVVVLLLLAAMMLPAVH